MKIVPRQLPQFQTTERAKIRVIHEQSSGRLVKMSGQIWFLSLDLESFRF